MAKSLLNGSEHGPLSDSMRAEQLMQAITLGSEESIAALRAFLDRRKS
jgi:enoyl-CoA hydratase/carnithine racemase